MLHSFHYYTCYALLCLLHQQQQAASLTIIIDGATTNEWATRDEYQRLMESSGGPSGSPAGQRQFSSGRQHQPASGQQQLEQQLEQLEQLEQQQQQVPIEHQQEARSAAEELESALDRLDLIEEQERHIPRQKLLKQLEQLHNHHRDQSANQALSPRRATIEDMFAASDQQEAANIDSGDLARRLKVRESTPQRYCGRRLTDVLELVCQGRFYSGEFEPQIVNPTIKSKRFIDLDQRELQHKQPVSPKRKLRILEENSSATQTITENDGDKENIDNNNHYLSSSTNNDNTKQNLINDIDNYQTNLNNQNNNNNIRNKHSKMALYRRIRGITAECCHKACHLDDLKPYCQQ